MSLKNDLRENARTIRSKLSSKDNGMAARNVAAQIIMLPELDGDLANVKTIAGYYPINDELDALVILKVLHAAFYPIALPTINKKGEPLEFHEWDLVSELESGPFGTLQSTQKITTPDILIVPMLSFDKTGMRLGYGGGYYDRTIKALKADNPELITIGVAYKGQKLDHVPSEAHDQKLDLVVTEKTTYRFD